MPEVPARSAASSSQESALLQCLSQLDSDTWAEVLLPKLVDNESAGNVALTCTQLRTLCHDSRQQLNLRNLHSPDDPSRVLDWTAALADRFPNCSCVELSVEDEEDLHGFPYLVSALARLPKLQTVKLSVDNSDGDMFLPMLPFSTMLYALHSQLPCLADLSVTCQEGLSDSALPWRELGRATRLTRLEVLFPKQVEESWPDGQLTGLAGLSSLKVLQLAAQGVQDAYAPGQWGFISVLTALTRVHLSVASTNDVCSLATCVALEDVAVQHIAVDTPPEQVQDSVWESIVQLTRLLALNLACAAQHAPSPAFAAISCLSRLTGVGFGSCAPAVLPVLRTLPNLRVIAGRWEAGSADGVTLTSVRALGDCAGSVPFEAFPYLKGFHHVGSISTAAFSAIARHCTRLRFVKLHTDGARQSEHLVSLASDGPAQQRVAAIQSLSALTSLSTLQLVVNSDAEVAAVAATAAALLKAGCLQTATIELATQYFLPNSLMLLAKLSGLAELQLHVARSQTELWHSRFEAALFLSALCGVKKVTMMVEADQYEDLLAAVDWLAGQGLAGPLELAVRHAYPPP